MLNLVNDENRLLPVIQNKCIGHDRVSEHVLLRQRCIMVNVGPPAPQNNQTSSPIRVSKWDAVLRPTVLLNILNQYLRESYTSRSLFEFTFLTQSNWFKFRRTLKLRPKWKRAYFEQFRTRSHSIQFRIEKKPLIHPSYNQKLEFLLPLFFFL